jgi:hypothetical protein
LQTGQRNPLKNRSESLAGIFTRPPELMADLLSSEEFFAGGPAAGLRVLAVYMAYAAKRLTPAQKQSLKQAKDLLLDRARRAATLTR